MPNMPDGLKIEVYNSDGKLLYRDMSDSKDKQFRFKQEKGKSYFMIVRPGRNTGLNREYVLSLEVESL
jgi:hypothetical protein